MNYKDIPEEELRQAIRDLKKEKNAIILAHYYQEPGIQEVADFIGDSLGLSKQAAETDADIILFAGVHFMAETASILNPDKKVLIPDLNAGCSLADSCQPEDFQRFVDRYPDHKVVTYINCSAEIKAMSDVICTSSNALGVVNSFDEDEKIIFAPDRNFGAYLKDQTGREMLLWDGVCDVHEVFSWEKIERIKSQHPEALFIAHPESKPGILSKSDFVGSTSAMLKFVQGSEAKDFIIATEAGILHEMSKKAPEKNLIPAPVFENNQCACSECPYMKMNTLEKVYQTLLDESPEVCIEEHLRNQALLPLRRMLEYTN